jgi:succinate dehydrogenase / fumarate reductase, flavoprotein subunit
MWETYGVVRDQAGLRCGLERVAELAELAGEVDVRLISEGYTDLAHALDLGGIPGGGRGDATGGAGPHRKPRRPPQPGPPRARPRPPVNFQVRLDPDGRLRTAARPVPPELQALADATQDVSVAGRLLE